MGRIAVLPSEIIDKIAAGEVVERPSSVVKELCENSLDARARSIRVELSEGGLWAISVTDDGQGMARDDALASVGRHATSKLRNLDGLFRIATLGFRGEALAAISAVCRFSLHTSEHGAEVGTKVEMEGGNPPAVSDAPPIEGTRAEVRELFFNTPARRKFMRRPHTELSHSLEAVHRLALSHPEVAFFVEHDGKPLLSSPAAQADPRERIAAALGPEAYPHLREVAERRLGVRVSGYVASPELTLPNARGLYTFVNRRYVRDRGLNHAVQRAFQETLPHGRQPLAVLFIEIDPEAVDVNVHPQKLEVRFSDGRSVYEAVHAAVGRAIRSAAELFPQAPSEAVAGAHYASAVDRFLSRSPGPSLFAGPLGVPSAREVEQIWPVRPAFGQARPGINETPPAGYFGALRYLGALGRRFWACEGQGGTLVVVDPHAALERVRLEELSEAAGADAFQGTLFSGTVDLPEPEARLLLARSAILARLGIAIEPFGGGSLAVRSLPPALMACELPRLFSSLAAVLPEEVSAGALAMALRMLACHAAGQGDRAMGQEEIHALFARLDQIDFHRPCEHRTVVVMEVPFLELERRAR
ncbi:MAG: DNA mismatch repair endonuclease MutL [Myxococcales bacterium]|nr:DNA mismatch repair endonuclease MutL [Myxococcales bacterium]